MRLARTSPRVNARVRQVAPGKKSQTVAPLAESGPDKRVLAASGGLMSPMPHTITVSDDAIK